MVEAVALDSVPPIRRRAYEYLRSLNGGFAETPAVANAISLPTITARRALEDLTAYQLVTRTAQGAGKPDLRRLPSARTRTLTRNVQRCARRKLPPPRLARG